MAGYVIHLAIGQEYLRKHKNNENYEEFLEGVIAPDDVKDKYLTHYGEKSSRPNLKKYFEEHDIDTSYNKGYFLHLVTDYLFYNKYIIFSKDIYNDYDITNKHLIEKYNVKIPDRIKNNVFFKEGETKVFSLETAIKIIDEISEVDLEKIKEEILNNNIYWNTYRKG